MVDGDMDGIIDIMAGRVGVGVGIVGDGGHMDGIINTGGGNHIIHTTILDAEYNFY